jgi:membrane fusion protein, multidrug efflux system
LRAARDTQSYAQQQYDRRTRLLASGITSRSQFDQAAHALDAARQQVADVRQQIGVALANLGGDPKIAPERHPLVEQAQVALDRAELSAPTDGVAAKVKQPQVGDTIAASAPVFALVSTRDVWIEANFKEVQLAQMRAGEAATVEIDRYLRRRFSAEVTSVSPSTSSQFSLLPPENATGNWVKVVQRVPVLQLTQVDAGFLLQAGLSANVTVDTRSRDPALVDVTVPTSAGTVSLELRCSSDCRDRWTPPGAHHGICHAGADHVGTRHHDRQRRATAQVISSSTIFRLSGLATFTVSMGRVVT